MVNIPYRLKVIEDDREFVSSLANRIIEITPSGINDYHGNYEDYLLSSGIRN